MMMIFAFLQYASAYSSRVNETTLLFIETLAWTLHFVKSDFALNDEITPLFQLKGPIDPDPQFHSGSQTTKAYSF